jgi:Spy/CpxP family protein refolding chaperone
MTKPMKTIFSTAAVCIVIAFASVASVNASDNDINFDAPRDHKEHKHQGSKHKMKRMAKALSLSEEQKVEIKAIKSQAKEQHQTLHASMKEFKIAERNLLHTATFDEQSYSALQDTYQPVFAQLALIRAKAKHAVFNVLTTEQQVKWLKMIEHRKEKTKKMRD